MIKYCYDTKKADNYEMIETADMSAKMKLLSSRFSINSGISNEQMHFFPIDDKLVIGSVKHSANSQEAKITSEQYVFTAEEVEEHLLLFPKIISKCSFDHDENQDYQVDIKNFNFDNLQHKVNVPFEMVLKTVQAAIDVLLSDDNRHLVIISEHWDNDFDLHSKDLMAMITSFLPLQARRKLRFISYCNEKFGLPMLYKIVFCKAIDAVKLKSNPEFIDSYFVFLNQNEMFPDISQGEYVNYIVTHKEKADSLISFIDQKLSAELKNQIEIYDVICNALFLKVNRNPDKYLPHRKLFLKYLVDLYAMETVDNETIKFIFNMEKQLSAQLKHKDISKNLSLLIHFYNANIIGMDVVLDYVITLNGVFPKAEIQEYVAKMELSEEYNKYLLDQGIFPDILATQIANQINETTDLITLLDNTIMQYGPTILDHVIVQAAISEYLSTAVDYCTENDTFTVVLEVSKNLNKYNVTDINQIITQVTDKISHKLKQIEEEKEFKKKQEKLKTVKNQVYLSFEKLFNLEDFDKLLDLSILQDCKKIGITKYDLDRVAKNYYDSTKSSLALLFLGLSYDEMGHAVQFDVYEMEQNVKQYNDDLIIHDILLKVVQCNSLLSLDFIVNGLRTYLTHDEHVCLIAKKNKNDLWDFCIEHINLGKHNKRFVLFTSIAVVGVLLIIAVAVITTLTK